MSAFGFPRACCCPTPGAARLPQSAALPADAIRSVVILYATASLFTTSYVVGTHLRAPRPIRHHPDETHLLPYLLLTEHLRPLQPAIMAYLIYTLTFAFLVCATGTHW